MPFIIRSYRRFPVQCPVSYNAGTSQGLGTVWNFSVNVWKVSGDVPLRVGQTCPLTVTLPNQENIFVDAAIVRWVRGPRVRPGNFSGGQANPESGGAGNQTTRTEFL